MDSKLKYVIHCYICTNMLKQILVKFIYTRAGPSPSFAQKSRFGLHIKKMPMLSVEHYYITNVTIDQKVSILIRCLIICLV